MQIAARSRLDAADWASQRGARTTWIAQIDGTQAGFADLEPDGRLDRLCVHPRYGRSAQQWKRTPSPSTSTPCIRRRA